MKRSYLSGLMVFGLLAAAPTLAAQTIFGLKWSDDNGNASRDAGEPGLPGVTIYADLNFNGVLDTFEPNTVTSVDIPRTPEDESGQYALAGLPPGTHSIREVVPDGFVQTFPRTGEHRITLGGGGDIDGVDFGNLREVPGSIYGTKWSDDNGNAQRDAGEPGLAGVTIYSDLNANGQFDAGEPLTVTMADDPVTGVDEAGRYWLEDLDPGEHRIREVVPAGFVQTFPSGGAHIVQLASGSAVQGIEFGNEPEDPPASIHGTKWQDDNGNRQRDAGEPGLAGVTIYSDLNNNGVLNLGEPSTLTMADDPVTGIDESGRYWLDGLGAGAHTVREVVPAGFVQTFPLGGAHVVQLGSGQVVQGIDFGNQPGLPGSSIHGVKWLDSNGNGQRDAGEPGLAGVTIYLDVNENGQFNAGEPHTVTMADDPVTTSVDEAGRYWLDNLEPGLHTVREVVPDGFVQTFPPQGAHTVFLARGEIVEGIDFGNRLVSVPGSIHGTKWLDENGSGQRDAGEPGLAGVTIYSDRNANGQFDAGEPHTVTMADDPNTTSVDESGRFWLGDLEPGAHIVREVVPDGFVQTFPSGGAHIVQLGSGSTVQGIDFGNEPGDPPGSIHGTKWHDEDGNRQRDAGEPGLAGVTIYADLNQNGQLDGGEPSSVTMADDPVTGVDESGLYWLQGLFAGQHTIREVVPAGFVQTFPLGGAHIVQLGSGQVVQGIDFGNQSTQGTSSIHGVKWLDLNGNGDRDAGEPGLAGVTIYIDVNGNGALDAGEPHTVTMADDPNTGFDEAGHYWLDDLEPGFHRVREVVPAGFEQTFPPGGVHNVSLARGEVVDGINFGNRPDDVPGSIHGTKWLDENGDGRRDAGEPGLAGVVIYSDLNGNGVLDQGEPRTVTTADDPGTGIDEAGRYWLEGLVPGLHRVREVVPAGFVQTFPSAGVHSVQLGSGDQLAGIDFGNEQEDLTGSIHGAKWLDVNGNGERDAEEPGLAGVTIYLDLNGNGALDKREPLTVTMADDPDTATDEAGRYWLEDIGPGTHIVREVVPDGFVQTFPLEGTHVVQLGGGDTVEGIDFGNRREVRLARLIRVEQNRDELEIEFFGEQGIVYVEQTSIDLLNWLPTGKTVTGSDAPEICHLPIGPELVLFVRYVIQ